MWDSCVRFVASCIALLGLLPGAAPQPGEPPRSGSLTSLEIQAGWRDLLSEGLRGWDGSRPVDGGFAIGPGWTFSDGVLHLASGGAGGDLLSRATYEDFELRFEWQVGEASNSGVKIRVPQDAPGQPRIGPEYQVLDDEGHANGRTPNTSAGALYGVVAPTDKPVAPPGSFRRGRILARGDRIEHWLDGQRVVEVDAGSPEFAAAVAASKFAKVDGFARGAGHILLQDHGDEVWFRRVFLRDLAAPAGSAVNLDLGSDLTGWSTVGDAEYTGDGTTIVGQVTGGAQSFLYTDRTFGDFILDVDVRMDVVANSGIQVRSTVDPVTRVLAGYQVEIDPTERRWSGGLYDEMRRGWLDDLSEDERARAAFDIKGWNRYRIECVGPSLRASVNGIPTADHLDGMTLEGVIGLQVHNGAVGRFSWRDLSVRELGRHAWVPLAFEVLEAANEEPSVTTWRADEPGDWALLLAEDAGDQSLCLRYAGDADLRLVLRGPATGALLTALVTEAVEGREPLLRDADGTWIVTPATGDPGIERVLEVHAYGDRVAVVQDGTTVADHAGESGALSGRWILQASLKPGQSVHVLGVDRLERADANR